MSDRSERLVRLVLERELTARQRQVLVLLYAAQLSVTECARELGVCPSTVTRTRDRGLERMRRCLQYALPERRLDKFLPRAYNRGNGEPGSPG